MACIECADANGVKDLKSGYEFTGRIKINLHASTAQLLYVFSPDYRGLMLPKGLGPWGLYLPYNRFVFAGCENGRSH